MLKLVSTSQEHWYTVTNLGRKMEPPISPVGMNRVLTHLGYQTRYKDDKGRYTYTATEKGKPLSRVLDTGKKKGDGKMIQWLKWSDRMVGLIRA